MPKEARVPRKPNGAVLYVGTERVEILATSSSGADVHRSKPVEEGASAADLARSAAEAFAEGSVPRRACQLLLTQGMVAHRVVSLPTLAPAELRRVLQRKAANLLERPEAETLFAAHPLWDCEERSSSSERMWLVAALHRPTLACLREELRRRGIQVRKTSWDRLACLGALDTNPAQEPRATLLIGVEPRSIGLTLTFGSEPVHLTTLKGDLHRVPGIASALIQEARGLEAHWRKTSRGKELDEVRLIGMGTETRAIVEPALHAALRGVTVRSAEPVGSEPHAEILAAARSPSPLALDLSVPLPRQKGVVVASMLLAGALGAYLGIEQYDRLTARAERWAREAEALSPAPATVREVRANYERIVSALAAFEKERDRILAVGSQGIPLQDVLEQALGAFQGRAALMSLSCDALERGQRVSINGSTIAEPSSSLAALESLVEGLEEGSAYDGVVLHPPTSIANGPSGKGAGSNLEFSIQAKWRSGS